MQSQLVCNGCRNVLLYPRGATNVCCAICNTITPVPPPGMEMAQLVCGNCRTLLMYTRGATSVRCSCCNTMNLARSGVARLSVPPSISQPSRSRCDEILNHGWEVELLEKSSSLDRGCLCREEIKVYFGEEPDREELGLVLELRLHRRHGRLLS
ncbi:protein LOL2-like [Asparagus officinalis]|uniref:protein LOL2-like n=1 Tax=Asparagus officinalis TaxID=4686 RepID=UPI00098E1A7B|nr:protein LOL2-like [Asparagus officinalis]